MEAVITDIIENKLKQNRDFALFRFPGSKVWHKANECGYKVDLVRFGDTFANAINVGTQSPNPPRQMPFPSTTDTSHYLNSVKALAYYHKERGGKTVLSRVICVNDVDLTKLAEIVQQYFDDNANAFCAMVYTWSTGLWIVASPELLLKADGKTLQTMSLAGTRPDLSAVAGTLSVAWDAKNRLEQQIVTRFITDEWSKIGLEAICDGPYTLRSNRVEHICTYIKAAQPPTLVVEKVLDALSPTPAVCGYPRQDSMQFISAVETHKRDLYGGYIAVTCPDGHLEAYVTLRCARINSDGRFAIFAGGGITGNSDPETELRESELKAGALYNLLQTKLHKPVLTVS